MATSATSPTAGETRDTGSTADVTASPSAATTSASATTSATTAKVDPEVTADSTEEKADRPPIKDIKYVQYIGQADVKMISTEDFARVGIEAPKSLTFSRETDFRADVKDVNAAVLDYFAARPTDFTIV